MVPLVLLTSLLAFARGAAVIPKIVGGFETTIEKHPFQLSLELSGVHLCGASVLTETRALTAAHCTKGHPASALTVRAGTTNKERDGQVAQVARTIDHPLYSDVTADYDVSVLVLATPLEFNARIRPIPLHGVGEDIAVGKLCAISGWGALQEGGAFPLALRTVDIPKVSDEECRNAYAASDITDRMTCYGYAEGGRDTCQRDSGGPLVCDGVQVGIVSWGHGCAQPHIPGIYARIAEADIHSHIVDNL